MIGKSENMRDEENEMGDQDNNICEFCHNVTNSFIMCENCGWIRCDDCLALTEKVVKKTSHGSFCPKCGSERIVVYDNGKKVPQ